MLLSACKYYKYVGGFDEPCRARFFNYAPRLLDYHHRYYYYYSRE